jgi:hypothetical protein
MTAVDRIRAVALLMPEVEERIRDAETTFTVDGRAFVICTTEKIGVRAEDADGSRWIELRLVGDIDWVLVEDRIARSWELTAPSRLLEAGGR